MTLRIVYDASSRANPHVPSLNVSLYAGPPFQNHLWSIFSTHALSSSLYHWGPTTGLSSGAHKEGRERCT